MLVNHMAAAAAHVRTFEGAGPVTAKGLGMVEDGIGLAGLCHVTLCKTRFQKQTFTEHFFGWNGLLVSRKMTGDNAQTE
jgi:hypothetical protein